MVRTPVVPDVASEGPGTEPEVVRSDRPLRVRRWWMVAATVAVLAVGAAGLAIAGPWAVAPGAELPGAEPVAPSTEAEGEGEGEGAGGSADAEEPSSDAGEREAEPGDPATDPEPESDAAGVDDPLLGPDPALPPVGLGDVAVFDDGVTASLGGVDAITAEAQGPGEVAGPAVSVTVVLANGADEPAAAGTVVVNVYVGEERAPGEPMTGSGADPFTGEIDPGEEAAGVYVFRLPVGAEGPLHVTVSHDPTEPTAVFTGSVPGAA